MIINNTEVSYLSERDAEEEYLMFSFSDTAKFIVSGKTSNYRFPLETEYFLNMLQQFVDAVNYKDLDMLERAIYEVDHDGDICIMTKLEDAMPVIPDSFSMDSCEITIYNNPDHKPYRVKFTFGQNGNFLNMEITVNGLIWFNNANAQDNNAIALDAGRLLNFLRMVNFATYRRGILSSRVIKSLIMEAAHIMCDNVTITNDDTTYR